MESRVQLVVGLGNPGPDYERTRHNAGFWFLDDLARAHGGSFRHEKKFGGDACKVNIEGSDVWLLKPMTFMNRSGQSVAALTNFYKIDPEAILVAHDELDIEPGQLRLKRGGGNGGHNGLRDIDARLGNKNYLRLRIGIGHPGHASQVTGYVLGKPPEGDRNRIEEALSEALIMLPRILEGDLQTAQNRLHGLK